MCGCFIGRRPSAAGPPAPAAVRDRRESTGIDPSSSIFVESGHFCSPLSAGAGQRLRFGHAGCRFEARALRRPPARAELDGPLEKQPGKIDRFSSIVVDLRRSGGRVSPRRHRVHERNQGSERTAHGA